MQILIEPSGYNCRNMGDLAMLQITVARLKSLLPDATVSVITESPHVLMESVPGVVPVSSRGRGLWFHSNLLPKSLHNAARGFPVKRLEQRLRRSRPATWEFLVKMKSLLRGRDSRELTAFLEVLYQADLLVVSGAGGINDSFLNHALTTLDLLEMGQKRGIPVLMFGQGIGPITDDVLWNRAKEVLPKVHLIAIREKRAGLPLLLSMGVDERKILVTGDDAIELAYEQRSQELGTSLGVNLRVARYSVIEADNLAPIREILQRVAEGHQAELLPVPISHTSASHDPTAIKQLLQDTGDVTNGGETLDTVAKVVQQISRCRVVVTGSYHAGVFALAQGIPVVAIVNSVYYRDKFLGLEDQFNGGCEVIDLQNAATDLEPAINRLWQSVEAMRPSLLAAAETQIKASRGAYHDGLTGFLS